jgi:hypothetical protein
VKLKQVVTPLTVYSAFAKLNVMFSIRVPLLPGGLSSVE